MDFYLDVLKKQNKYIFILEKDFNVFYYSTKYFIEWRVH